MTERRIKDEDREEDGKFRKGNPGGTGNPAYRRTGEYRRMLERAGSVQNVEAVLEMLYTRAAVNGDVQAAKVWLERVLGKPKDFGLPIKMPAIKSAADMPKAYSAVVDAVRRGDLSPDDLPNLTAFLRMVSDGFGEPAMRRELDELKSIIGEHGAAE